MSFLFRRVLRRFGIVQTHPVAILRNIRVPMPDGIELLTDIYLGKSRTRAPVVLIRSPYGKGFLLASSCAYPLASQGYNVVMQSCRGTFGSAGTFDPHHDEQRDGLATIEWITRQTWYDGSIATFGMSYLGYTQWAVATASGPEVKAMAMQATVSDFSRMAYSGNSFALESELTWTQMMTSMKNNRFPMLPLLASRLFGIGKIRDQQWLTLPLASMDEKVTGERVPFWQDWLQHSGPDDPWWGPISFRKSIGVIKRPISMVAGWFDIFLPWQLQDFIGLREAGSGSRITIGPWRHTDAAMMSAGLHDAIDWFNRHLLGKSVVSTNKPVKLYVIGADEWRHFDEWPPRESVGERWYLHADHTIDACFPSDSQPDKYRYDPSDPTPSIGGPALESVPFSVDNATLEARSDVVTYTSARLTRWREMIGPVTAELFVSSSAASADFFVRLCDVDDQGVSKNICDGLQRVEIETTDTPQRALVELWPTAYRLAQGHRLRVQISSGAFPRWSRNLGGIESLGQACDPRAAIQSIYHSAAHPSAVTLPFTQSGSTR